jgi:hypothetical protein
VRSGAVHLPAAALALLEAGNPPPLNVRTRHRNTDATAPSGSSAALGRPGAD